MFFCRVCLCLLSAVSMLTANAQAAAEEAETFVVRAKGFDDNTGFAARRQAIAEACRDAVLDVLQNYLPDAERYLLEDMLSNPSVYIQRYDVLRHDQDEQGTRVEVDVHILEEPLFRDLARMMLPRLPKLPEILIVMGEQIGHDRIVAVPDFGVAEMTLREAFEEEDLPVSGVDSIDEVYSQAELIQTVEGEVEVGAEFARENLADVIIIGAAVVHPENPDALDQLQRHKAVVEARVYRSFDGKMIEAVQESAAVHGADPMETGVQAVEDACAKLVGKLRTAAIIAMLGVQEQDKVLIHIENPGNEERVAEMTTYLREISGVGSVEQVFYSAPRARLHVDYYGPLRYLVEALTDRSYADAPLELRSAIGREITVDFPQ